MVQCQTKSHHLSSSIEIKKCNVVLTAFKCINGPGSYYLSVVYQHNSKVAHSYTLFFQFYLFNYYLVAANQFQLKTLYTLQLLHCLSLPCVTMIVSIVCVKLKNKYKHKKKTYFMTRTKPRSFIYLDHIQQAFILFSLYPLRDT